MEIGSLGQFNVGANSLFLLAHYKPSRPASWVRRVQRIEFISLSGRCRRKISIVSFIASSHSRVPYKHGAQNRCGGRARHQGRRRDHVGHPGDGLNADLLDMINQGDQIAGSQVLDIFDPHLQVLPVAAKGNLRKNATGDCNE